MTAATREKVLAALEQACRETFESEWLQDVLARGTSDEQCVRYGPLTPAIARRCGVGVSMDQVRRALAPEVAAGRVLRQSRNRGMIRWWPVGMLAKLKSERWLATGEEA